jgi:hypothetical protein
VSKTDCPSREAFEKSFRTDATLEERERMADHAMACPSCRARMEVLLDVRQEIASRRRVFRPMAKASLEELKSRVSARPSRPRRFLGVRLMPIATAGALLAAALVAVFIIGPLAPRDGVMRDGEAGGLVLLSPKGEIKGTPMEFRWDGPVEANTYFIEVIDDRLAVIIPQTGTVERFYSLPIGYENRFAPGRTYIWSLTAVDDVGRTIGTAQRVFTVQPVR